MFEFKLENDISQVKFTNRDGTVTTRSVSTADLLALFANQAKSTDIVVPPGARQVIERDSHIAYLFITPSYKGNIQILWDSYDTKRADNNSFKDYIPKVCSWSGNYDHSDIRVFPIPFPATAVLVDFIKGNNPNEVLRFRKMWAWALRDTVTPYDSQIAYRWPFTNVYGHHAVCIGNVPSSIRNIDAAASYVRFLYNGLGNHDLDSNAKFSPSDHGLGIIKTPYQMITSIIGADSFPVDYLAPVGDLKSVVHNALTSGG